MVAHNTGSTVTCSVIKLAYYNLKLYELEIYDLIVAKVALKVYRYRYRHRGKSLFTYRLLTELKIPLPYISAPGKGSPSGCREGSVSRRT